VPDPTPTGSPERGPTPPANVVDEVVDMALEPQAIPRRIAHWLVRLFGLRPKAFASIVGLLLVLILVLRIVGIDVLFFVPHVDLLNWTEMTSPLLRQAAWMQVGSGERECVDRAQALGRPYVLRNVEQFLQYEDDPHAPGKRFVHERIFYTVLPLEHITSDQQTFLEEYSGSNVVTRWFGPKREVSTGGRKYQVAFSADPAHPVTGAEFMYHLPLRDGRTAFREKVTVNHDRDFWYYENVDDVICQLTQVIESRSLRLLPVGEGAWRIGRADQASETPLEYQPDNGLPMTNSSLSATWVDLLPGDDAGMVFKWEKAPWAPH
jgi:hypothetical protein